MSPRSRRSSLFLIAAVLMTWWPSATVAQVPIEALCPVRVAQFHGNGNLSQWSPASPGPPMVKVTLNAPQAVCNDGTPAVMYVRPSPLWLQDPANPDGHRWVIHFKGGGMCTSYDECEDRWCSTPQATLNIASLMSNRWAPDAIVGTGIHSSGPANDFGDWNHVLLNYCSSDGWTGNIGPDLAQPFPGGAAVAPYTIQFRGAAIAAAAFAALAANPGVAPDPGILPDGVDAQMPSLRLATTVVISGDSAGANGVRHHIDRIADRLVATTLAADPPLVLAVTDAGAAPQMSNPGLPLPGALTYTGFIARVAANDASFWGMGNAILDQSCVAQAADINTCHEGAYVMLNHVTTPAFARTDLFDAVGGARFVQLIGGGGSPLSAQLDMATLTAGDLALFAASGTEPRQPISTFGPLCGTHIAIRNNANFQNQVAVPNGQTFHDAVSAWVQSCMAGA